MNTAGLIVLILAFLDKAWGDSIYHLRNDGLFNNDNIFWRQNFKQSRVTMCYNGADIFVAESYHVTGDSTVYRLPNDFSDPNKEPDIYQEIPDTHSIAIDCCCQYIVYGYPDAASKKYKIQLRSMERDGISIDFYINDSSVIIAAINVLCDQQIIRLTTQYNIYMFDIMNPGDPPEVIELGGLVALPRCAATWTDETTEYLITSFEDRDAIQVTPLDGSFASELRTFVVDQAVLKTACISVDGDHLYSFSRMTDARLGTLIKLLASDVINNGTQIDVADYVQTSFAMTAVNDFVNGVSVCIGCEARECMRSMSPTCLVCEEPGFNQCGFCSSDRLSCMCANPQEPGCKYDDGTDQVECIRPIEKLDAYCVVYNPEARRRTAGPIDVAVIVAPSDQSEYDTSTIRRAVKTGRWPLWTMPVSEPLTSNSYTMTGYSALVPDKARGKRFGFFSADIARRDGFVENIYCLSTEKSAFRNNAFTYVTYEGGTVTIEVTMDNNQYQNQVTWRMTNMETGKLKRLSNSGKLSMTISPVYKRTNEGLYEVYRQTRQLRTWHPLIYLYVRACTVDRYGPRCDRVCGVCDNGICDVATGRCRCYPGFTGTGCRTACNSADLIGQNCEISCSRIMSSAAIGDDCINLEICGAEDLACGCRSGLQPPDCIRACSEGMWGPNCQNVCTCNVRNCDARVGCI